jgi:hypothetical protein
VALRKGIISNQMLGNIAQDQQLLLPKNMRYSKQIGKKKNTAINH